MRDRLPANMHARMHVRVRARAHACMHASGSAVLRLASGEHLALAVRLDPLEQAGDLLQQRPAALVHLPRPQSPDGVPVARLLQEAPHRRAEGLLRDARVVGRPQQGAAVALAVLLQDAASQLREALRVVDLIAEEGHRHHRHAADDGLARAVHAAVGHEGRRPVQDGLLVHPHRCGGVRRDPHAVEDLRDAAAIRGPHRRGRAQGEDESDARHGGGHGTHLRVEVREGGGEGGE
mmetsp:Transcript_56998/g.176832  ORF Transcript_56998/g.176832 Transcript_56998/m.176832 type:complete len:235 (-) Transcript_56998:875-1579(-)